MLGTTDWLLKRFLKFVLKRNVGKYLTSEIDLEQLDVKLDTGKLELKNLLLNCDAVNKELALDGWLVKAGYVGSVNAKLPSLFSSSSQCSVVVNEVMLTVAPAPPVGAGASSAPGGVPPDCSTRPATAFPQDIPLPSPLVQPTARSSSACSAINFLLADDFGWTGQGAVMDGIKRIAGSLQSLLQHMRVEASNVLVRVELPHPTEKGRVVTAALKLDLVEFSDLSSLPAGPAAAQQHPHQQANDHRNNNQGLNHKAQPGSSTRPGGACDGGGTSGTVPAAAGGAAAANRREIDKYVQVKGLSLDLFETTPLLTGASAATGKGSSSSPSGEAATAGATTATAAGVTLVSGPGKHGLQLNVEVRMVLPDEPNQPTQISADLHLGAVRLQLLPSHAVCLAALKAALDQQGAAAAATDAAAGTAHDGGGTELWVSPYPSASASMCSTAGGGGGHWGRRSLFESIMMPNCEGVVAHSLEPYALYGEASEFHDACSRFGSLASSLVSSVTQTGTNLLGYVTAGGGTTMDLVGSAAAASAMATAATTQVQQLASQASLPRMAGDLQPPPAAATTVAAAAEAPRAPLPVVSVRAHVSHAAFVLCYNLPSASSSSSPAVAGSAATAQPRKGGGGAAAMHANGTANPGVSGSLVVDLQDLSCDVLMDAAQGNSLLLQAGQLQLYEQLPAAFGAKYGMTPADWGRVPEVLPQAPYRFRPTQPAPTPTRASAGYGTAAAAAIGGCGSRLVTRPPGRNSQAVAAASGVNGGGCALQTWPILLCASTHTPLGGNNSATSADSHPHLQTQQHPHAAGQGSIPGNATGNRPPGGAATATSGHGGGCLRLRAAWGGSGGAAADGKGASAGAVGAGYLRYSSDAVPAVPSCDLSVEVLPVTVWVSLPLVQRLADFVAPLAAAEPYRSTSYGKTNHHPHHALRAPKPHWGPLTRLSMTVVAPHLCVLLALVPPSSPSSSSSSLPSQAAPLSRAPGTPVFIALDVVSPPHPSVDATTHGSLAHGFQAPLQHGPPPHGHPQQQHQYYQQQQNHHYPYHGVHSPAPVYGTSGAAPHGGGGGFSSNQGQAYGVVGAAAAAAPSSYGNGWTGAGNHHHHSHHSHFHRPYGAAAHGCAAGVHQPGRLAWGRTVPYWPPSAWAAIPEPPALLSVFQVPATDRLIPSQVTTVDLAAGTVELLLVRTASAATATAVVATVIAAEGCSGGDHRSRRGSGETAVRSGGGGGGSHPGAAGAVVGGVTQQRVLSANSAGSGGAAVADTPLAPPSSSFLSAPSWTCKSLLCLSPTPPQVPASTPSYRSAAWDTHLHPNPSHPHLSHRHAQHHPAPLTGPGHVPPGCGLHLHVCADPGSGSAPELVSEAWGHVAAHAQDRWADPDGEGGAWEERSSFRSVAFHERCRRSSATFLHLHAPKALLHLTRADLADLAALPATVLPPPPPPPPPLLSPTTAGGVPAAQSCVLLEIGLQIQLQDDPPPQPVAAAGCVVGVAAAAGTCSSYGHAYGGAWAQPTSGPTATVAAGAVPAGAPAVAAAAAAGGGGSAAAAGPSQGLGLVLGGSRVAMYELVVDELTVFRASNLGAQAGCHVTSVHADGVTLLGHLEQQHQQLQHQLQQAAAVAAAAAAAAPARGQRPTPSAAAAAAAGHQSGIAAAAPPRRSLSGGEPPALHATCLVHCPAAAADSKQPSYVEYVCVEGRRPQPPLQAAVGRRAAAATGAADWGPRRISGSGSINTIPFTQQKQQQQGDDLAAATAMHSVLLQGVTVTTDHGYVTMDWAVQLGQLLESLATAASSGPGGGAVAKGAARGHLSVNVVDLALRHEPMDYPATATAAPAGFGCTAVGGTAPGGTAMGNGGGSTGGHVSPVALALIIEAIHLDLPLGAAEQVPYMPPVHTVVLHSLTLHLAAADQRGPGWTAADPRAIREPLLQACSYHRVLQEASIKVVAKQRRYPKRVKEGVPVPPSDANVAGAAAAVEPPAEQQLQQQLQLQQQQQGEFHPTLDVEVTNQHLLGMLTVESATLLAHFAMQAGTLMTARQAAAAAAAALPRRCGDAGGRTTDLYWDAAASENGSSAVGGAGGSGTCGYSEAGGDAAGSLLTSLLLEEVEENAFRWPPPAAAGGVAGAPVDGEGAAVAGVVGGGWYTSTGGGDAASGATSTSATTTTGLAPGGLILIDDFFPVNHQGEYDEDLMVVPHPPKGSAAAWRRDGFKMELEGTWYGPDEGPDRRRTPALVTHGSQKTTVHYHNGSYPGVNGGYGFEPETPPMEPHHPAIDSGSINDGVFTDVELGGTGGPLFGQCGSSVGAGVHASEGGGGGGGADLASDDPDIDDLMMTNDPQDGGDTEASRRVMAAAEPLPPEASVGWSSSVGKRSGCVPTWRLQEDYVRVPRKSDEDGRGGSVAAAGTAAAVSGRRGVATAAAASAACGGGGGPELANGAGGGAAAAVRGGAGSGVDQPPPVSRITFKDLSGIWVMHTTRSGAAPAAAAPAAAAAGVAGSGGGNSSSGQQEGRVELVVEGLGLVFESYGPGGHLARHTKLTVHDLEIRDCVLEVKQQQRAAAAAAAAGVRPLRPLAAVAAAAAAASGAAGGAAGVGGIGGGSAAAAAGGAAGGGGWVRVLGYRAVRGRPRDSRAPLVALALTAVRPNPAACDPRDEEFRLTVALLPLRLKLTQDIMSYLTWYGTSVSTALKPAAAVLTNMQAALSELDGCEPLPPPYFQRAQIRGFSVLLDYRPRRVDISALAEGRLLELLNLVPLGGVDLNCKPLTLAGVQGWDGLGAAVLREWLNDIARTQAHKFITGLAPVNAVVKVGAAVATLISAPARHLARRDGAAAAAAAGRQLAAQLRRTSATFAHQLVCEAMVAGRRAANGAGKALARVGSHALNGAYGTAAAAVDASYGYSHHHGEEEEYCNGCEGDIGRHGEVDEDNPREEEDGEGAGGGEGGDYCEDGEEGGDRCGALLCGGGSGGGTGEKAEGGALRRSRSASVVVRKGLSHVAAMTLGSTAAITTPAAAPHQVAAATAAGVRRSVSNVARALSVAAPASAVALQGQLKGTLRSVRRVLRAQLSPGGFGGGGSGGGSTAAADGYPLQPHSKVD